MSKHLLYSVFLAISIGVAQVLANDAESKQQKVLKPISVSDFYMEIGLLASAVVMLFFTIQGKSANKKIADTWLNATKSIWEKNFALVGDGKSDSVIVDGSNGFFYYGSGRVNVERVLATIDLKPRGELTSTIFGLILDYGFPKEKNYSDRIVLKAHLPEAESDGFVMGIFNKSDIKQIMMARWDLETFGSKIKNIANFPVEKYNIVADAPHFAQLLWDDTNFQNLINNTIRDETGAERKQLLLEYLTISDMPNQKPTELKHLQNSSRILEAAFKLPHNMDSVAAKKYCENMLQVFLDVVDYVGQFGKFSVEVKTRLKKMRDAAEAQIMKSSEDERKKKMSEKKYAEKKAKMDVLAEKDPKAFKKLEAKDKQKEMRKTATNMMKAGIIPKHQ